MSVLFTAVYADSVLFTALYADSVNLLLYMQYSAGPRERGRVRPVRHPRAAARQPDEQVRRTPFFAI